MKPKQTARPTVDKMLTRASKLRALRNLIQDCRAEQETQHAEVMAALQDTIDTMSADNAARRETAILEGVAYCTKTLTRRFRCSLDIEDIKGIIALAVTEAHSSYEPTKGTFTTYAYQRAKWRLEASLGQDVVTPSRTDRRKGFRVRMVSLDAPHRENGMTLADALAAPPSVAHPAYNQK
jgi:hypothetical protein